MSAEVDNIILQPIEKEMKSSYLDYAMSVIVSRAIPDVRDGLKPVHRRIIYAMDEQNIHYNRPYKKSARIVGDVMGKYHPHGDGAIYDSLVRMAQDFSMGQMLVDGQGNFGSMDGDSPAAMRYTESRMSKIAHSLIADIDKDTVNFQPNYDGSEHEPSVLPARYPNMLVNGGGGIAVGMATNIPTYNLGEVITATTTLISNPEISDDELLEIIPAPDFPTGGQILGRSGAASAFKTGRGSVIMRAKHHIEEYGKGREAIIIDELPYQVNKAKLIEKISELHKEKKIEGISDLRDESDKQGVRVVCELKTGVQTSVILNQLFKLTPLQSSFAVNMLALDKGRPKLMNIREVLTAFIDFRQEVITRRTNYLLNKARDKAHILVGLSIAVANIDEVIALIRSAPNPQVAKEGLMAKNWAAEDVRALIDLVDDHNNEIDSSGRIYFTEVQAKAILEMRLSKLTGLEQEKLSNELKELAVEIQDYLDILGSAERVNTIITDELTEVKENFATERKTVIEEGEFEEDMESLIPREDMVVTVTMGGYIKRTPLATYKAQRRGGKGRNAVGMHDEDVTTQMFAASTHTPILFFTGSGKVYKLKNYKLPLGSPTSKGRSMANILPIGTEDSIDFVLPLPENDEERGDMNLMFATANGNIRRSDMADFERINANGKIAIMLDQGDSLIGVAPCDDSQHVMLNAQSGKCNRFEVSNLRVIKSRTSNGVKGMTLADSDSIISMTILNHAETDMAKRDEYLKIPTEERLELKESGENEMATQEQFILAVTENGFGKRTSAYAYSTTNRGGKGVVGIATSERNGEVVASFPVEQDDEILLVTNKGKMIRTRVAEISISGRSTQGVKLFNVADGEKVISVAHIDAAQAESDEDEIEESAEVAESTEENGNESENNNEE